MPATKVEHNKRSGYDEVLEKLKDITKEPSSFLIAHTDKELPIQETLQQIYKLSVQSENNHNSIDILPELVFEDMHVEQIWQQLELRNNIVMPKLLDETSHLLAMPETNFEIHLKEDEQSDEEEEGAVEEDAKVDEDDDENDTAELRDDDEYDEDDDDEEDDLLAFAEQTALKNSKQKVKEMKKKVRSSIVDDKFFKLEEMKEFLEIEDAKEMRKQKGKSKLFDDDGIDYFADDFGIGDDGDEESNNPNYNDFFDPDSDDEAAEKQVVNYFGEEPEKNQGISNEKEQISDDDDTGEENDKEVKNSDSSDDDQKRHPYLRNIEPASSGSEPDQSDNDEEQPKSSFELRQARLEQRIKDYEEELLSEKPWQLKGEIQAGNRPQNSLLEEVLEFESTVRPAPIITEETTRRLEDIIKQRIKDEAWDDVERKVKPIQTPQEFRKQLVLDQEKSKQSLAQIYEKEYQKELEKLDPNHDESEEEPKEHQEIRHRMRALFSKLDILFNLSFTPTPVAPEPKIITNAPALNMEEALPIAVSDAKLLAPEEVYKPKRELIGKSERSRTDKKRERRKKKQKQRAIHNALEERDLRRQKLGIPLSKKEESAKLMKKLTKHRNVEKLAATDDKKALKSSSAFFTKLQDTTSASGHTSKAAKTGKRKPDAKEISAKRLKL